MKFDGQVFIDLANELYQNPPIPENPAVRESQLRSCISRAYYGAYLIIRLYLLKTQTEVAVTQKDLEKDKGEHYNVQYFIKRVAELRGWGERGDDLKDYLYNLRVNRNNADYSEDCFDLITLDNIAQASLELADKILEALFDIQLPPPQ